MPGLLTLLVPIGGGGGGGGFTGTPGSIIFLDATGNLAEDNANFFRDIAKGYIALDAVGSGIGGTEKVIELKSGFGPGNYLNIGGGGKNIGHLNSTTDILFLSSNGDKDVGLNQFTRRINGRGCVIQLNGTNGTIEFLTTTTFASAGTSYTPTISLGIDRTFVFVGSSKPGQNIFGVLATGSSIGIGGSSGSSLTGLQFINSTAGKVSSGFGWDGTTKRLKFEATIPTSANPAAWNDSANVADFEIVRGSLTVNGAQFSKRIAVGAGDYNPSVLTEDFLIAVDDTAALRTITISTEDINSGTTSLPRFFIVKDESNGAAVNNITVQGESGTIDGVASITISANSGVTRIYADGTNLFTL